MASGLRTMQVKAADAGASVLASLPDGRLVMAIDRLASTANGTPLWIGATAGLSAAGRRGRLAAAEGVAAFSVASVLSNLLVKPLVHRDRPIRLGRGRGKRTSSFPSSHASTSFAYASAVVGRWPVAGAPLLVAATAIAASRVHASQHRISEVAAGAVLGVVVGTGVHLASAEWSARGRLGS